jgi:bidirectional [NiFe] hydrogenase diaphorase subunit
MTPIVPDDRDVRGMMLERAMARHQNSGDALIEILHAAQQLYGYLSRPVLSKIARTLKLPPSGVLGVATFYHLFRFTPASAHSAIVCLGTACYAEGATEVKSALARICGAEWTIETGRCVGSCGLAPIVIYDGLALSKVRPEELEVRLKGLHDAPNANPVSPG